MRVATIIAVSLFLFVQVSHAGDFDTGMERYLSKDYSGALGPLRSAAGQGDANAQAILGVMYSAGQGVNRDDAQGASWTVKAAQQGMASAQARLGALYSQGIGVALDYREAYAWFEKAALQGSALGQFGLANAYANGQGVSPNDKQAAFWFGMAAEQDLPDAQLKLGLAYEDGKGVEKSDSRAAYWYEKAASHGLPVAEHMLGIHYLYGLGVVKDSMRAASWLRKAADHGIQDAKPLLAELDAANVDQAREAVRLCERKAAAELDDGVSPANVIASAVMTRCARERDSFTLASFPTLTTDRLQELRSEIDRQSISATTATVLEFRAAKRRQPGAQPRSTAKPKPET